MVAYFEKRKDWRTGPKKDEFVVNYLEIHAELRDIISPFRRVPVRSKPNDTEGEPVVPIMNYCALNDVNNGHELIVTPAQRLL